MLLSRFQRSLTAIVVSQAFATLSDPEKKKRYDLYGHDSVTSAASSGGGFRRQGGGVYEHDISPEELFEMMFGLRSTGMFNFTCMTDYNSFAGGFRTYTYSTGMNPRQRPRGGGHATHNAADSGFSIFQLMPLLLLLFSILLMSAFNSGSDEVRKHFRINIEENRCTQPFVCEMRFFGSGKPMIA